MEFDLRISLSDDDVKAIGAVCIDDAKWWCATLIDGQIGRLLMEQTADELNKKKGNDND